MAVSVLLVTLVVLLSVKPASVFACVFTKCCPHGEEIRDGHCTNSTTATTHNSSLTFEVTNTTCLNWRLLTDPHNYLENCTLLVEKTNQTLSRNEFCVEWANSTYLPFKCKHSVDLYPVKIARNHSIEEDDSPPNPSEYWWYDTSHSKFRMSNIFPVRKCCPQHEILSHGECIQSFDNSTNRILKYLEFLPDNPCRFGKKKIDLFDPDAFIQNGTLLLPKYPGEHPELCVDWEESVQDFRTFYCLACEEVWTEVVNSILTEELVDGGLFVLQEDRTYNASEWWRDSNSSEIKACVCIHQACVRKCCSAEKLMNTEGACSSTNETLNSSYMNTYKLIPRDPCRAGRYMLYPKDDPLDAYEYLNNGSIVLTNLNNLLLSNSDYCVDRMEADGEFYVFPCFPEDSGELPDTRYTLYPVGMLISEPFLLATMLVYGVVPELRNLHGLSLMSHVSSLFMGYLVLPVVQLAGNALSDDVCKSFAFIIYFSFLASFFWLNVMCLDIWWTFSGFRPLRGSVKEREHKKFIIYSLYSWGCPLIMLSVAMVMDLHPDIPDDYIKPRFGDQKCWFDDKNTSALYYFVGPIAFLLVCNIVLFIFTAVRIRQLKNETKILQRKDSKRHDDEDNNRQRFNLYLKLFLVMGVNWIMEIISWFAGGPDYLWYVTDIGNTLQGVLIFIIFVWKDRVRRLLMERFCPKRAMSGTAKSVVTSTRSITRTSPSRNNTLNTRTQTQERNSNHEDYRMKPLMETSCTDVP